jgi:hypothetical protein
VPDRTVDMSFLIMRELLLPVDEWAGGIMRARNELARTNSMAEREAKIDWKDMRARSQVVTTAPSLE